MSNFGNNPAKRPASIKGESVSLITYGMSSPFCPMRIHSPIPVMEVCVRRYHAPVNYRPVVDDYFATRQRQCGFSAAYS